MTPDEEVELTGILELDRIFTLLNAKIIAESAQVITISKEIRQQVRERAKYDRCLCRLD